MILGFKLFLHAFKMLFFDFKATIRITLIPLAIGYGIAFALAYFGLGDTFFAVEDGQFPTSAFSAQDAVVFLFAAVIMLVAFCWSAVGWHRYTLLNEQPKALLPLFDWTFVGAYVWASIKLVLVLMAAAIPMVVLLSLLAMAGRGMAIASQVIPLIIVIVMMVVFYRFSLILTAVAVGRPMSLSESWKATNGYSGAILAFTFASFLLSFLTSGALNLLTLSGLVGFGAIALVLKVLVSWLNIVLGVSILTTFYGYLIEKRELE